MTLEEIYASMGMKPPTLKGPIAEGAADRVAQIKAERAAGTRPTPTPGALDLTDTPGHQSTLDRVAQIKAERESGVRNVLPGALDLTDTPGFAEAKAKVDAQRQAYRERQAGMGQRYAERLARDAAREEEMSKIRAQKYGERLERNQARADAQGNAYMQLLKDRGYMNTGGLVDFAKGEALNYALPQSSFYGRMGSALGQAAGLFNQGGAVYKEEGGGLINQLSAAARERHARALGDLSGAQLPEGQELASAHDADYFDQIKQRNAAAKEAALTAAPLAEAPALPAPTGVRSVIPKKNPLMDLPPEELLEVINARVADMDANPDKYKGPEPAPLSYKEKLDAMTPEELVAHLGKSREERDAIAAGGAKKPWWKFFNTGGAVKPNLSTAAAQNFLRSQIGPLGPKELLQMGKGKDVSKIKYKKQGGEVTDEVEVSYHNPFAAAGKSDKAGG